MDCDRFDVALFRFPFSENRGSKIRPALVLSHQRFNAVHHHAIMTMITTASKLQWPSDLAIEHFAAAGLTHPCVIRWKIFTLDDRLYLGRVGRLDQRDIDRSRTALATVIP